MRRYIPINCFGKEYCKAERNQTFDEKEGNLYLEEGTLKIKKKQIKAGKETTIPMDKWRNMVA